MRIDPPMSNKLYILTEHDDVYRTLIQEKSLPQLDIVDDPTQANIVLGSPPMAQAQFEQFKQLEWLQAIYAGLMLCALNHCPSVNTR
ncbi:D-3-phosphoglycerate dehydrogenase [Vibrio astriarenae]|nr:D-3-phosphoglycerate dehydrogenase [Vibrio sp. C7]